MAFIIFFFSFLKKFEKVEKTGIISTKFSLRCTPSVILGIQDSLFDVMSSLKDASMENAELRIIALVKLDGTVRIVQFVFQILDVNMGTAMNRLNVTAIQAGLDLNVKEVN